MNFNALIEGEHSAKDDAVLAEANDNATSAAAEKAQKHRTFVTLTVEHRGRFDRQMFDRYDSQTLPLFDQLATAIAVSIRPGLLEEMLPGARQVRPPGREEWIGIPTMTVGTPRITLQGTREDFKAGSDALSEFLERRPSPWKETPLSVHWYLRSTRETDTRDAFVWSFLALERLVAEMLASQTRRELEPYWRDVQLVLTDLRGNTQPAKMKRVRDLSLVARFGLIARQLSSDWESDIASFSDVNSVRGGLSHGTLIDDPSREDRGTLNQLLQKYIPAVVLGYLPR